MISHPRLLIAIVLAVTLAASSCGAKTLGPDTELSPTSVATNLASTGSTAEAVPSTSDPVSEDVISGVEPNSTSSEAEGTPDQGVDQLPLPTTAAGLAAALTEAERTVRQQSLSDDEARAWGRRQQRLYRTLAINSAWKDEVLASVDDDVAISVGLNWEARENLTMLANSEELSETMPAWEVVEPLPPQELVALYKRAEEATGVSWEFMAAINLVETRMGRIRGISTAGAVGPMQFLPTTWAECCEGDPTVPADAIMGAAQYLVDRGGPDNMPKAIRGYNNSGYYVNAVTAYAEVLMSDERAYWGYHGWEIYFRSSAGLVEIPIGYYEPEPVDAEEWVAENPDALFGE